MAARFPYMQALRKQYVLTAGLISLVLSVLLLSGCSGSDAQESPSAEALPVVAQPVTPMDHYTVMREFSGRVESGRQSALAFELSGRIDTVLVEEGDRVAQGDVLARLDTDLLNAERRQADAALEQRRSQLKLARQTLKRFNRLLKDNAVSRQEVDEARERVNSLEAGVKLEEARLQTIETRLEKASLKAPYDAVIARRNVDEGAVVGPQQPLLELVATGPQDARIAVTAGVADRVRNGDTLSVEVRGQPVKATLKRILPVRDARTQTVDLILAITEGPESIRPGDLVVAQLPQQVDTRGFWVPYSALTDATRGLWGVYSVEAGDAGGHHVALRTVEVLHQTGDRAFVRGTLEAGDRIVAEGTHRMVPGLAVRVMATQPALTASRD